MRRLLLLITILVTTSGGVWAQTETPTPTSTPSIFQDVILEFEDFRNSSHPYLGISGDCIGGPVSPPGTWNESDRYSNQYAVAYPGTGFSCSFSFYGSGVGLRYLALTARNQSVLIDGYEAFQMLANEGYISKYVDLELGEHIVDIVDLGTGSGNTPWLDYILLRTHLESFSPEATAEVTQAVEFQLTPDGATYYATVVFDEVGQTVAFRYQVDVGQVMIVILLTVLAVLLLVMFIAQIRRGAPEP